MTPDFIRLLEGLTLVAGCWAVPWFFCQIIRGGAVPYRLATLVLWGVGGGALCIWLLPRDAAKETVAFLWLAWLIPCMLLLWTNWMREWPLGLLKAKATLEELKAALSAAETIRLGGRAGAWVFFVLAWLSLLAGALDVPIYEYSAWLAFRGGPKAPSAWLHADSVLTVVLALAWLFYVAWLFWIRDVSYFGSYRPGCQNTNSRWRNDYPTPDFLLCSPEEAAAFLRLFADACPLPNLDRFAYLPILWKLTPTVLLYLFRFYEKPKSLGFDAGVIPFLNAASGVLLLVLLGSIVPWLFRETRQWRHPDRVRPCAYAPLLRLARYARKLRDRPCRNGNG